MKTTARLNINCVDKPGLVAEFTSLLFERRLNITGLDQYSTAPEGGHFFLRLEFQVSSELSSKAKIRDLLLKKATSLGIDCCEVRFSDEKRKTAILASRTEHAPLELLWRWRNGELNTDITMVISNHETLREHVERAGIPFHWVPVTPETKPQSEAKILELLDGQADLVVLARYMQILSPEFVARFPNSMINIHHSFLPAFMGANPYGRAHERGVKIIGATAHYVTSDLDEGPIIEQGVARVSHRDTVSDLKRRGRDIEREVLARAVSWHLDDRVLVHGNKTVVFS